MFPAPSLDYTNSLYSSSFPLIVSPPFFSLGNMEGIVKNGKKEKSFQPGKG
jgi:hypothetical protein